MVTSATNLTRSGLSDFLVQRVSAVVIAVYIFCVFGFFVANPDLGHGDLVRYFGSLPMQIFSTLAILSTVAHAWIGLWTVGTDYIRPFAFGAAATWLRAIYQIGGALLLFVYVAWALKLFWSL